MTWRGGRWALPDGEPAPVTTEWRLDVSQLGNEDHKFIVDQLRRGEVRVRVGGFGAGPEHELRLNGLAKKLGRRFAVMVSPGEHGSPQLLVHPKPGTSDGKSYFSFRDRTEPELPKSRPLAQAMVREDVWRVLCEIGCDFYGEGYKRIPGTLDAYRRAAREAWDAYREEYVPRPLRPGEDPAVVAFRMNMWKTWGHSTSNPVGWFTGENPSISGFGMDTSWEIAHRSDLTEAEVDGFLDVLAQATLVENVVRTLRLQWRPVGSSGPQFGEWRKHERYLKKVLRIASRKAHREEIREAEQRGWRSRLEQERVEKAKADAVGTEGGGEVAAPSDAAEAGQVDGPKAPR